MRIPFLKIFAVYLYVWNVFSNLNLKKEHITIFFVKTYHSKLTDQNVNSLSLGPLFYR